MITKRTDNSISGKIKEFFHPALMTILSGILVFEVTSIQTDIKSLLTQSSADKTEIANLKQQVDDLNKVVFMSKYKVSNQQVLKADATAFYLAYIGDRSFINEEEYDIKKYMPRRI